MRPRLIDTSASIGSTTTRGCESSGCYHTTREGKPFCPDHVENHSYVQNILKVLAEREDEEQRVRQRGPTAVDPDGLTAQELVLHLSLHGSRTVERLSREFQLEARVMNSYVDALMERGLIILGRTTRGSTVVRLA